MTDEQNLFGLPTDEATRQQILDQAADAGSQSKWSKTLAEYVQVLEALYQRRGMPADEAFRLAADSVLELAEFRGGRAEYLPRGDALRTAIKHAEIFRRINGRNFEAIADEFQLTVIQVYRIYREQRALHRAKIQGSLFQPTGE